MNLFEKKAWELKVIDDRGHQFFIQDLMDFDDIVRSSGMIIPGTRIYVPDRDPCQFLYFVQRAILPVVAAVNIKLLLFSAIFEALEHTE